MGRAVEVAAGTANPEVAALPRLRPELNLISGTPDASGATRWLIHDPVQNRFIQIDATTYHLLACWPLCQTRDALTEKIKTRCGLSVNASDIEDLVAFLHDNKLTTEPADNGWRFYAAEAKGAGKLTGSKLLHQYLFFRLPLVQPQAFLKATRPIADVFATRRVHWLIIVLGGVGIYLVSRQWEAYWGTFQNFFNLSGWIAMLLVLALVKAAHELGHAYTAIRYGARVATMGVAFMMLMPLLYTDVTDAWRLKERSKRLRIDSAGIRVELAIAAVSLFVWALMPDGIVRSLAFVLSAVTLISSLLINLNPFMRFDGYYLFSEMIGMENLQARAFALGKWKLRAWLFALGEPPPEMVSRRRRVALIGYAYATWIYRLVLFLGIALLVYHFCFKVLGVLLFGVEVVLLILKPVWTEMKTWFHLRRRIFSSSRTALTIGLLGAGVVLLVVPWSGRVVIPAVLDLANAQSVFAPRAAQVKQIHVGHGDPVRKGQPLVVLQDPALEHEAALTKLRLRLAHMQYARRGSNARDLEQSIVLEMTIASLSARLSGLRQQIKELTLLAPVSGHVLEVHPELHARRWLTTDAPLFLISGPNAPVAKGYVREDDLWRIAAGNTGRFIPEFVSHAEKDVRISAIGFDGQATLSIPDLASPFGGPVAASLAGGSALVPTVAQYLVRMPVATPQLEKNLQKSDLRALVIPPSGAPTPNLALRGVVIVEGRAESLLARMARQIIKVIMRETGA